jgi:hypothetical protein
MLKAHLSKKHLTYSSNTTHWMSAPKRSSFAHQGVAACWSCCRCRECNKASAFHSTARHSQVAGIGLESLVVVFPPLPKYNVTCWFASNGARWSPTGWVNVLWRHLSLFR